MSVLEPLRVTQLEADLYQFQLDFVHAFLIHDETDGWILIDAGFPVKPEHPNLLARALKQIGLRPCDIDQIVITHSHPDHVGNLDLVEAQSHAPIWMSDAEADVLEKRVPMWPVYTLTGGPSNLDHPRAAVPVSNRITGETQLSFAGGIDVVPTPGHSIGHCSLLWHRHGGVLFTGDLVVTENGRLEMAVGNENYDQERESLNRVGQLQFNQLLVSHGDDILADAAGVYRQALPRLITQAQQAITIQ